MRPKTRIVTAVTVVALLSGGGAAVAEAATSPSASPSPTAAAGAASGKAGPLGEANARAKAKAAAQSESLAAIAARLHVSVAQLENALRDAKQYLGEHGLTKPDAAVDTLVAKDLGISVSQARALVEHVFSAGAPGGEGKRPPVAPGTPDPRISAALAKVMGISQDRAIAILERLDRIAAASGHGVTVTDPAFRALAASVGLTPDQLGHDIQRMKQSLAASMPAPSQSPAAASDQPSDLPSGKA